MKEEILKNIESIYVSTGYTVNIGNYESVRFDAGITIKKPLEFTEKEVFDAAWNEVQNQVQAKVRAVKDFIKSH